MDREERLSRVIDYVIEHGVARVEQIADRFEVSIPTVRRDLDSLAAQQLITRTRGGARVNTTTGELPMRFRTSQQWQAKNAIARAVPDLVAPGSVIAFNGGTTTTAAAYEVGVRVSADERFSDTETTIVTNAVNIANDLIVRPHLRIVVLGGVARPRSYELIGPLTSLMLPEITIDTLFLGVSAIDLEQGLFTHDEGEASVNAALVHRARRTVVLADAAKLQATAFARICRFDQVDAILTDAALDHNARTRLEEAGLEVTVAGE